MAASYLTLRQYGQQEIIINKSRFIGHGCPVSTEEEALAFLARIREKHKDATHNCYAYIIGQNAGIQRYSDDSEPSGTAGMPIIEVMKARGVVDCAVVVTRYFGGVLLGAGGLVRAYSKSSAIALDAAQVVAMHETEQHLLCISYAQLGRVDYVLDHLPIPVQVLDRSFGSGVDLTLAVKKCDAPIMLHSLTEATGGQAETLLLDTGYQPWPEDATGIV